MFEKKIPNAMHSNVSAIGVSRRWGPFMVDGGCGKPYALESKNEEPKRVQKEVKKDQKGIQKALV